MPKKCTILITGISGLLGGTLVDAYRADYSVAGLFLNHPVSVPGTEVRAVDILNSDLLKKVFDEVEPDVVIHCASMTNVDACQSKTAMATEINVLGTRNLVTASISSKSKFIYISTDSVYSGDEGNYSEDHATVPQNHYGRTKLDGEIEALKGFEPLIFRTNIFGWNIIDKLSLGEWVLDNCEQGHKLKGFTDAVFSSIYTYELARVIEIAIQRNLTGIYNCGSRDACSKFDFAQRIAHRFGYDERLVMPASIDSSNLEAKRGKNLSLDTHQLESALGYTLPTIDNCIDRFYRDFHSRVPNRIKQWQVPAQETSRQFIQYGRQWITDADVESVVEVINSDRITQGPAIANFENAMAKYCGSDMAVAVNSGTSALHIACLAAGLKSGEEVITSPITFVASANCAVYCGAVPRFCDIDSRTYNMSPEKLAACITSKTRVVIPVHFAGQSCDMEAIRRVVNVAEEKHGRKIFIIEDASHAIGSAHKGRSVGSCQFADMAVTSFHPVKHITTGEGGMVFCNEKAIYTRLMRLRSHGISNTADDFIYKDQAFDGNHDNMNPWYYEQVDVGYNYRITDLQCALGRSQLKRIEQFRHRRREIVQRYNTAFGNLAAITIPHENEENDSNFHLYVLQIAFDKIGITRRQAMEFLLEKQIQTQVHYIPVHTQPYYQKQFGYQWGDFTVAESYYRQCLSIPLYPAMSDDDVTRVIDAINALVRRDP